MTDFSQLKAFLDSLSSRFGIPGCDCAVYLDGKPAFRHRAGFRDEESAAPMTGEETWWIYSATKLFTCTAALQLVERGQLALSDEVAAYLPEFGELTVKEADGSVRPAREKLTIRHLMTMTGGLDYDLTRPALAEKIRQGTGSTRQIVAALAADPLVFDPGEHFLYSLCHDVLGAVIEVVSGKKLAEYIAENISGPLGMADTTFHPTPAQLSRMATQYAHLDIKGSHRTIGQGNHFRFAPDYDSGGAGLLSTVDDYIRLAAALSLGGVSADGVRILSEESVKLYASDHLTEEQRADYLARSPAAKGYSYGLGVRVRVESGGSPLGEFGWDGAAGAYALVDTENRVAMFYAQQVCNSWITYQLLHPELRDTLYRCLEDRHV